MVRWLRAFARRPETGWEATVGFWSRATGSTPVTDGPGAVRLLPSVGEWNLELLSGATAPDISVDLLVDDPEAAVASAFDLGATATAGDRVCGRSPGGLAFRVQRAEAGEVTAPPIHEHANGSFSSLDQICIDIGPSDWDEEVGFWEGVTGREARPGSRPEYVWIKGPDGRGFRLLLQRLEEERPAGAHLDFACSDVAAVREAHLAAGARGGETFPWWTVMYDPAGEVYCLTARDPITGALPS